MIEVVADSSVDVDIDDDGEAQEADLESQKRSRESLSPLARAGMFLKFIRNGSSSIWTR